MVQLEQRNSGQLSATRLPTLKRKFTDLINLFAVANYKNHTVVLSGGQTQREEVDLYNLKQKKWTKGPCLNYHRFYHSSCCLGKHAYVFGGEYSRGAIESFQVEGGKVWHILSESNQLVGRWHLAVAILNDHSIAIYGGRSPGKFSNKGIVFDTQSKTCMRILGGENDLKFQCFS